MGEKVNVQEVLKLWRDYVAKSCSVILEGRIPEIPLGPMNAEFSLETRELEDDPVLERWKNGHGSLCLEIYVNGKEAKVVTLERWVFRKDERSDKSKKLDDLRLRASLNLRCISSLIRVLPAHTTFRRNKKQDINSPILKYKIYENDEKLSRVDKLTEYAFDPLYSPYGTYQTVVQYSSKALDKSFGPIRVIQDYYSEKNTSTEAEESPQVKSKSYNPNSVLENKESRQRSYSFPVKMQRKESDQSISSTGQSPEKFQEMAFENTPPVGTPAQGFIPSGKAPFENSPNNSSGGGSYKEPYNYRWGDPRTGTSAGSSPSVPIPHSLPPNLTSMYIRDTGYLPLYRVDSDQDFSDEENSKEEEDAMEEENSTQFYLEGLGFAAEEEEPEDKDSEIGKFIQFCQNAAPLTSAPLRSFSELEEDLAKFREFRKSVRT